MTGIFSGHFLFKPFVTNELFSYGPAINSLEFDGSNYAYDANGKLVAARSGNGLRRKKSKLRSFFLLPQDAKRMLVYATETLRLLLKKETSVETEVATKTNCL